MEYIRGDRIGGHIWFVDCITVHYVQYIRVSHPCAFFDLITGRKVAAAAYRRSNGSDTLSNVRSVHASRYTTMHVARSDRERPPPRVPAVVPECDFSTVYD